MPAAKKTAKTATNSKKVAEGGVVQVERYWTRGGEKVPGSDVNEETLIEVPIFEGAETTRVGATLGMTLNMGNYESVKVSISCSLPSYLHDEEMEAAYAKALEFAKTKLTEQVKTVKSKTGRS